MINTEIIFNGKTFKAGEIVKCSINGDIVVGYLYKESTENHNYFYILHNNITHRGNIPSNLEDKLREAYKYSWVFREINGSLSDQVILIGSGDNLKLNFNIQNGLSHFLKDRIDMNFIEYKNVVKSASSLYSIYDNKDIYGLIKFYSDKGSYTEMKFGRFIKTYINDVKKFHNIDIKFSDSEIEKIHNDYILHQKENSISIEILKGESILEGYCSKNYLEKSGRLGGSCMSDKPELLKLYTQNEDVVNLLVVKTQGKIIARSLIWNSDKGKVLDQIYTTHDWVSSIFDTIKEKYIKVDSKDIFYIDINVENIDKFPYLDTFMYLSTDNKLTNNHDYNKPGMKILRNTDGSFQN